jgi:hypothetical protein
LKAGIWAKNVLGADGAFKVRQPYVRNRALSNENGSQLRSCSFVPVLNETFMLLVPRIEAPQEITGAEGFSSAWLRH